MSDELNYRFGPKVDSVDVMGVTYRIHVRKVNDDSYLKKFGVDAYCCSNGKFIVLSDHRVKEDYPRDIPEKYDGIWKHALRHELVHAFLNECGLDSQAKEHYGPWSKCEEMVDWWAIVGPRVAKAWKDCGCI